MKRVVVITAVFSLLLDFVAAQEADTSVVKSVENKYIQKMDDYLAIRVALHNDIKGFVVNSTNKVDLEPNDKLAVKLTATYRGVSLSASVSPKFIPGNDDDLFRGKTTSLSLTLRLNSDHWVQELYYSKVKGYYVKNTADLISNWVDGVDPYIQFPDLNYQSFRGITGYKFNENYSVNALNTFTERQLKSVGTFMPILFYDYYIVDNRVELTGQNSSQKSNNFESVLSLAYFHTFVIKRNFGVSFGVNPGVGFISTKILTRLPNERVTTHQTNPVFRLEGTCRLAYDAIRFFTGAQAIVSTLSYNQDNTSTVVRNQRFMYQVLVGYRFYRPGFKKRQ